MIEAVRLVRNSDDQSQLRIAITNEAVTPLEFYSGRIIRIDPDDSYDEKRKHIESTLRVLGGQPNAYEIGAGMTVQGEVGKKHLRDYAITPILIAESGLVSKALESPDLEERELRL